MDMCPPKERQQRVEWHQVDTLEREHPERPGWVMADMAVTKYARPEAGQNPQVAVKVRPPHVLSLVMDYLMTHIADIDAAGPDPRFLNPSTGQARAPTVGEIVAFMWDRFRMMRLEYNIQYCKPTWRLLPSCIEFYERAVRFLLVTAHELRLDQDWVVSVKQNHETEMVEGLKTLTELYRCAWGIRHVTHPTHTACAV